MVDALAIAAFAVSIVSAGVTVVGVRQSKRSAVASERSASVAVDSDRRARTPKIRIVLDAPEPAPNDRVIYRLYNDGPQDLDSITVYRPEVRGGIVYPIAGTDVSTDWEDEVNLGQLRFGKETRITLCCGRTAKVPEFRVRITCRAGGDTWELVELLPSPRLAEQ